MWDLSFPNLHPLHCKADSRWTTGKSLSKSLRFDSISLICLREIVKPILPSSHDRCEIRYVMKRDQLPALESSQQLYSLSPKTGDNPDDLPLVNG